MNTKKHRPHFNYFRKIKKHINKKEYASQSQNEYNSPDVLDLLEPAPQTRGASITKTKSEGDMRELCEITTLLDFPKGDRLFQISIPTIKQVFTSESALQAGIFSSVFKLGYYQETLPGLEKTEFVEPIAGTIEDLFEWCLFFPESKIVKNVLLGYRRLNISPNDVIEILERVHKKYSDKNRVNSDFMDRIFAFIVTWLLYWGSVDLKDIHLRAFISNVGNLLANHNRGESAKYIKSLLKNKSLLEAKPGFAPNNQIIPFPIKRAKSSSRINYVRLKNTKLMDNVVGFQSLLFYDPKSIAEQLTLNELQLFKEFTILDFFKKNATNSPRCLNSLSNHFNAVSSWVTTAIIAEPSQKKQLSFLKMFIIIAKKLFRMRNYSTCCQIISGLNNIAITRLKYLVIPPRYQEYFNKLEESLAPKDNYGVYRSLSHSSPCIPLLPVCLKDLTVYSDNFDDYLDHGNVVVNVEKIYKMSSIVYHFAECVFSSETQYPFTTDDELQIIVGTTMNLAKDDEQLYNISTTIQPVEER